MEGIDWTWGTDGIIQTIIRWIVGQGEFVSSDPGDSTREKQL